MGIWNVITLIFVYSVSLSFYFIDMFQKNKSIRTFGYRLLFLGGVIQSATFTFHLARGETFPLITLYEVLYFYSLLLILLIIVLRRYIKWQVLEITTVFINIIILLAALMVGETLPSIEKMLVSKLLFIHILLAIVSYSLFSLSAIFSFLFLVNDYFLKKKRWNPFIRHLPSLESLEKGFYYSNSLGVLLLLMGLIIGSIWANSFFDWTLFVDPKVLISFVILFMYSYSIYHKRKKNWTGKQYALWNVLCLFMVLLNIILTNILDSFHRFS